MQESNRQQTASLHDLPANGRPAEPPALPELPAASGGMAAPANGTRRPSVFAPAWRKLQSADWVKRIADSSIVRALRKALDDTQPVSQRDDKNWP